jgi:hypothetical protein
MSEQNPDYGIAALTPSCFRVTAPGSLRLSSRLRNTQQELRILFARIEQSFTHEGLSHPLEQTP